MWLDELILLLPVFMFIYFLSFMRYFPFQIWRTVTWTTEQSDVQQCDAGERRAQQISFGVECQFPAV